MVDGHLGVRSTKPDDSTGYQPHDQKGASQLLDDAAERTTARRVRDEIDALRRHLEEGIGDEEEDPAES
jgi:hypothetical protein